MFASSVEFSDENALISEVFTRNVSDFYLVYTVVENNNGEIVYKAQTTVFDVNEDSDLSIHIGETYFAYSVSDGLGGLEITTVAYNNSKNVEVENYAANVTYHAAAGTYLGIACDPYTVAVDITADNLLNGDYKLVVSKGADTWVANAPGCVNMDNLCVSFSLPVGIGGAFDEAPANWTPGAPEAGKYTVRLFKGDVEVATYSFDVPAPAPAA